MSDPVKYLIKQDLVTPSQNFQLTDVRKRARLGDGNIAGGLASENGFDLAEPTGVRASAGGRGANGPGGGGEVTVLGGGGKMEEALEQSSDTESFLRSLGARHLSFTWGGRWKKKKKIPPLFVPLVRYFLIGGDLAKSHTQPQIAKKMPHGGLRRSISSRVQRSRL